jgi:hypothetical protein
MARILAYQTPATELRNRGHDVALRTLAARVNAGRDSGRGDDMEHTVGLSRR